MIRTTYIFENNAWHLMEGEGCEKQEIGKKEGSCLTKRFFSSEVGTMPNGLFSHNRLRGQPFLELFSLCK